MPEGRIAVLSGGLDSAALCVDLAGRYRRVLPIYLRFGFVWEALELAHLQDFLAAVSHPRVDPVEVLELPMADAYGAHWSLTGLGAPLAGTSDAAVYLPGKNLVLLAKAAVWGDRRGIDTFALATLMGNPFGDNSPGFYDLLARVLEIALGRPFALLRPYSEMSKADVIRAASALPLERTFSCISPVDSRHCGRCNKCAERREGFRDAGVEDRTIYATEDGKHTGASPGPRVRNQVL